MKLTLEVEQTEENLKCSLNSDVCTSLMVILALSAVIELFLSGEHNVSDSKDAQALLHLLKSASIMLDTGKIDMKMVKDNQQNLKMSMH